MKKKWKIILGAILLVIILAYTILEKTKPLEAEVIKIEPQSIAKSFKEEGLVISGREYPLYSLYGGRISSLPVSEGQAVTRGEVLLSFDTQELTYQLEQLKGQQKSLEAQRDLEVENLSLEKLKVLYEAGAISQKEYEDARNTIESQYYPGLLDSIKAQRDLIAYKIAESTITAPIDGIVSGLTLKEGMILNPGQQALTLIQTDSFLVEVFLLTSDTPNIYPGMEVLLIQKSNGQDLTFAGKVEKIAPSAVEKLSPLGLTEQRLKITIRPEIPKIIILRPGYALNVEFTPEKLDNQLVIPKTALFPYQEGEAVWVVRNERAQIQKVAKGFENDREIAVLEGLNPGDEVIRNPQLKGLKDGLKIKSILK